MSCRVSWTGNSCIQNIDCPEIDSINIWARAKFSKSLSMYISESLLQLQQIFLVIFLKLLIAEILIFFAKIQLTKNRVKLGIFDWVE